MATSTACSLLAKLSPEIRNLIYELALIEEADVEITVNREAGLSETCRQIRQEFLGLYYSLNTFRAMVFGRDYCALDFIKRWLTHLGSRSCRHIRKVYIDLALDEASGLVCRSWTSEVFTLLSEHM